MSVRDNVAAVRKAIGRAAQAAGRDGADVKLVAVSKKIDTAKMLEAVEAGIRIFGENRIQEARSKQDTVCWPDDIVWHLIGSLQRNKSKLAVTLFDMIQSVDSLEISKYLNRHAGNAGRTLPLLIQVNLADEPSKSGFHPDAVVPAALEISRMEHLRVKGLMAIPPYCDNPEDVRPYFRQLRHIKNTLNDSGLDLSELSMGMSSDFEIAIEEGATMVRVGTAIFGQRRK